MGPSAEKFVRNPSLIAAELERAERNFCKMSIHPLTMLGSKANLRQKTRLENVERSRHVRVMFYPKYTFAENWSVVELVGFIRKDESVFSPFYGGQVTYVSSFGCMSRKRKVVRVSFPGFGTQCIICATLKTRRSKRFFSETDHEMIRECWSDA